MNYFNIESRVTNIENNDNQSDILRRMRNNASECIESCSMAMATEAGQKMIAYVIVGTIVLGAILIFGTGFATASEVRITNKTSSSIYPSYISPYGAKTNCGGILFPGASCTAKFTSYNYALDLSTLYNEGTLHVNKKCDSSLKDGPSNRQLKSNGILFWTCYVDYDKATKSTDSNSTDVVSDNSFLRKV